MSSDWELTTLSDLVRIKHGFAFKGEFFSDKKTNYQLTTPGNFSIGGGFQSGKAKYYSGPVPEEFILKANDLLVTMTDLSKTADTLGYAATLPDTADTIWLHNQRIGLVEIKPEARLDISFLHYLMRSPEYRHWIVSTATGSTVRHTSPGRICSYQFLLPTLPEQQAIGALLKALDDRITLLRETNKTLESIAQAIFKSWFVDFDPVRAKMEGRQPEGMDGDTAALFPDSFEESELGLVPNGWKIKAIGEVINTLGGATPNTKNETFWAPEEFHWTTPKDLSGAVSPVLLHTERRISAVGLAKISSGLLPTGTLLMSSRAPIGYLTLCRIPVAINQGYIAMPPGDELSPLFMYFWCRTNMEVIKGHANGSTFMEISKKAFRPIPILVPSPWIIDGFTLIAESLFDKISANTDQANTLISLRDTLLPRLISGQLRLSEAEELTEGTLS